MKRFLLTLAVLMVSITATFAKVLTGDCGTNVTYNLDTETGVLKIEGTGAMSDYSTISPNGIYVNTAPWRGNYQTIKSVNISQGVTSIGRWAFDGCSSLTSITIPKSVTSIGSDAFYGCSSLTSITIPEGVTSIGNSAFFDCSSLTSITIPASVTSIEDNAFWGCI